MMRNARVAIALMAAGCLEQTPETIELEKYRVEVRLVGDSALDLGGIVVRFNDQDQRRTRPDGTLRVGYLGAPDTPLDISVQLPADLRSAQPTKRRFVLKHDASGLPEPIHFDIPVERKAEGGTPYVVVLESECEGQVVRVDGEDIGSTNREGYLSRRLFRYPGQKLSVAVEARGRCAELTCEIPLKADNTIINIEGRCPGTRAPLAQAAPVEPEPPSEPDPPPALPGAIRSADPVEPAPTTAVDTAINRPTPDAPPDEPDPPQPSRASDRDDAPAVDLAPSFARPSRKARRRRRARRRSRTRRTRSSMRRGPVRDEPELAFAPPPPPPREVAEPIAPPPPQIPPPRSSALTSRRADPEPPPPSFDAFAVDNSNEPPKERADEALDTTEEEVEDRAPVVTPAAETQQTPAARTSDSAAVEAAATAEPSGPPAPVRVEGGREVQVSCRPIGLDLYVDGVLTLRDCSNKSTAWIRPGVRKLVLKSPAGTELCPKSRSKFVDVRAGGRSTPKISISTSCEESCTESVRRILRDRRANDNELGCLADIGPAHEDFLDARLLRAHAHTVDNQLPDAERVLNAVVKTRRGRTDPEVHARLAEVLGRQSRLEEASREAETAWRYRMKFRGSRQRRETWILNVLKLRAGFFEQLFYRDRDRSHFDRALETYQELERSAGKARKQRLLHGARASRSRLESQEAQLLGE